MQATFPGVEFLRILFSFKKREKNSSLYVRTSISRQIKRGRRSAGKLRDESFQVQAEKPLGTDSHQTISKRSSECWLLTGHKKCFVLLCPIIEQFLLSSFLELVHDGYHLDTCSCPVRSPSLCVQGKLSFSTFLTRNEGTNDESKNVSDAISRSDSICTEKILFLTDHNVS